MTKTDKIYKVIFLKPCFDEISINIFSTQVRCTYDTSSKNITFGMMPIRFKSNFDHYNIKMIMAIMIIIIIISIH